MILLAIAVCCAALAIWLAAVELAGSRGTRASLARVAGYGRRLPAESAAPPVEHDLPLVDLLARVALRLSRGRDRSTTAARLQAAGFARIRPERFLALKTLAALAGALVGAFAGAGGGSALGAVCLAVAAGGIAFLLPDLVLSGRARSRRERILEDLPNALDLLAVTVEAGLGLDASLARYADTAQGPLAEEVALLVTELRIGASRADVLRRLAERVPAAETKSFVRAVTHADQLGVSLSRTLRAQSQDARVRRQAVAEERANKAPVKMLFPTVMCIFPTLFVVVLGPALISLLHAL
jgi:tight adherence protein C